MNVSRSEKTDKNMSRQLVYQKRFMLLADYLMLAYTSCRFLRVGPHFQLTVQSGPTLLADCQEWVHTSSRPPIVGPHFQQTTKSGSTFLAERQELAHTSSSHIQHSKIRSTAWNVGNPCCISSARGLNYTHTKSKVIKHIINDNISTDSHTA